MLNLMMITLMTIMAMIMKGMTTTGIRITDIPITGAIITMRRIISAGRLRSERPSTWPLCSSRGSMA